MKLIDEKDIARVTLAPRCLRTREDGQAMLEYGMLVALVSVVSIAILALIGANLGQVFHTAFAAM